MDLTGNKGVGISESKQENKVCPVDCGVCQHCVIWNISGFFVNESLTVSAICCRKDGFDKSRYTLTGNVAQDVATIAKSQAGRTCSDFGYSGVDYGAWCDEYVADCLENAGCDDSIVAHGGTVADFEKKMRKRGAVVVSSPQPGDLLFFSWSHVEIVTRVEGGTVYCAGGNNQGKTYLGGRCAGERNAQSVAKSMGGSIRLYLRPNYPNPNPNPPTNLSITSNDGKYKVGDTVTFTFSCSNATEMYIPIDVNGERKYFIDVSGRSSYTCSFDTPGVYGYFLYAKNAAGEASTVLDYKQFRVDSSVPANLTISTDKNSYAVGEQITFSFSCDNAVRVAIPVDYNGKRTDFIDVTGKNTYTCSFDKAGIYGYFLYAENACGESTTEYIEFTVQDNPPSNLSISTDKSYYVIGETITFSFTSQNATRLAIPIDYNGKRVDFIDVTGKDTYTCSFDKAGTYGYFLYAENACGESSTVLDYKQIQVYDTIPGDLNADNTLTTADAVFLQNYLLNAATLTADQQQAADLNADGVVNALDLALLRQKLA